MPDSALLHEYFSFQRDLDNLFVEAGRQAHVIWRLDGSFGGLRAVSMEIVNPPGGGTEGIWAEPLRLADYLHFHVWDAVHGATTVEQHAKRYARQVGYSEILYQFGSHPYLDIRKTVWVPLQARAIVVELALVNKSDQPQALRLFAEFQSHLSQGWPLRKGGRNTAQLDSKLPALVGHDETNPHWTVLCGSSIQPEAVHLGDFQTHLIAGGNLPNPLGGTTAPDLGRSCLQYTLDLAPESTLNLAFVVSGSPNAEDEARATFGDVMARRVELRQEKCEHYGRLFTGRALLESPSYGLNKAFLWAKLGTEDFKHFDPKLGYLFFAGYPAYNFYFASDSMLILRGSLCFGDIEDAREMLRTIVRYQATTAGRDTLPGEIWHEMSTSGDRISPNFAGFLFPGLLRYVYDWSADRAFLEEMYPHARAVIDWGFLMDTNGDGLLENGPEGEMADSAWEDRNMERSQYTVQTGWFDALRAGIGLAELLGDVESARRWAAAQARLAPLVNRLYWNEAERTFEETLRPDGCLDTTGKGFPNLDLDMVDEGKAVATLRLLLDEEAYLTDIRAYLERRTFEETFSTHRAYMSWYVIERGRRARQLYQAHCPAPAQRALEEVAASPFHWTTPGLWPEVWAVDEPSVLRARGCFHQAWTPSHGFIYALVDGMLGFYPDAPQHAVTLDPHLPAHWPGVALRRLRLGAGWLDVTCTQGDGWRRLSVHNDADQPLRATLGFALEPRVQLRSLSVDGQPMDLDSLAIRVTPFDVHAYVGVTAPPHGEASAELHWEAGPVRLDFHGNGSDADAAPVFLPRVRPGTRQTINLRVHNSGHRPLSARIRLDVPDEWARDGALAAPVTLEGDQTSQVTFAFDVPAGLAEGHYTLRAQVDGVAGLLACRSAYLPVFGPVAPSLDGRQVARVGRPYELRIPVTSLTQSPVSVSARVSWPAGWVSQSDGAEARGLAPGSRATLALSATPQTGGDVELPVRVVTQPEAGAWELRQRVRVIPAGRSLVVYSGFLGCPIQSDSSIEIVNLPANVARRKPHVFQQLVGQADLILTSDQHDAVFPDDQIATLIEFVKGGGKLAFFCYWSAPWGRGFFDTFGNVAASRLPDILPLRMRKGIAHAGAVKLTEPGRSLYGDIAWDTIPAFDHNAAELRPGAQLFAQTETGAPLIAAWRYGQGQVLAIAADCFGFESYVEGLSFDWWPEKARLIRRSVAWLLEDSGANA